MKSKGIVDGHGYALLKTATVQDKYGKDVQLCQLKNPWGHGEWEGDWSDDSDCWTEKAKN